MIREVCGFAPYERRAMELLKVSKDKRALKFIKKRVGQSTNSGGKNDYVSFLPSPRNIGVFNKLFFSVVLEVTGVVWWEWRECSLGWVEEQEMDANVLSKNALSSRIRLVMLFFHGLHVWCGEDESSTDGGWVPITRKLSDGAPWVVMVMRAESSPFGVPNNCAEVLLRHDGKLLAGDRVRLYCSAWFWGVLAVISAAVPVCAG